MRVSIPGCGKIPEIDSEMHAVCERAGRRAAMNPHSSARTRSALCERIMECIALLTTDANPKQVLVNANTAPFTFTHRACAPIKLTRRTSQTHRVACRIDASTDPNHRPETAAGHSQQLSLANGNFRDSVANATPASNAIRKKCATFFFFSTNLDA